MNSLAGLLLAVTLLTVATVQFVIVRRTNLALAALEARLRALESRHLRRLG
jgi:hypothetical protein